MGSRGRRNLKQDFKGTEIQQFSMSIQVFGAGPCNSKVFVHSQSSSQVSGVPGTPLH